MSGIRIFGKNSKAAILVSGRDKGILRVASALAQDIRNVTGCNVKSSRVVRTLDLSNGTAAGCDLVIAAGIWNEPDFESFLSANSFAVKDEIKNGREQFSISYSVNEGKTVIVITGSDKLGTEYGLFHISEIFGVSPWHYFGDAVICKKEEVEADEAKLEFVSKKPSVEFRGFFLNDDWPSLGNWVTNAFGDFNEEFYEKVFDLLLRLKGNFLWPAMWSAVFSEDGKAFPTASAELADELGIYMGTSHHEPLFRAGEEFSHYMGKDNSEGYGADWSFYSNPDGLKRFWEDGVIRNKDYRSLITIGMRGERDSKILGEDATLKDNIDLLKDTIKAQKEILAKHGLADAPKVLALYKEVEDYFYGDKDTEGLCSWEGIKDATLLLSDDNFGNLRTLPDEKMRDRKAGWGIYYHFDYHGDPISYEWVNSTPLMKAWEQLTTAYEYGIRKIWIANVGDLRPQELPLGYFMALAYDYEKWSEPDLTDDFTLEWIDQQFGNTLDTEEKSEVFKILFDYTKLNGIRRPEATHPDTFKFSGSLEAFEELWRAEQIESFAESFGIDFESERGNALFGLVQFPALASANLRKMMIYAGFNRLLAGWNVFAAGYIAKRLAETIKKDKELVRQYNEDMSGGKWKGMMSSKHVDFVNWNDEGSDYPEPLYLDLAKCTDTLVSVNCSTPVVLGEDLGEMVFSSLEDNTESVFIMNHKDGISLSTDRNWVNIDAHEIFSGFMSCRLSVDWSLVSGDDESLLTINYGSEKTNIRIKAKVFDPSQYKPGTFVETLGYIGMSAGCFADSFAPDGSGWLIMSNYGKALSALKPYPIAKDYAEDQAPSLTYRFVIKNEGTYHVSLCFAPNNNPKKDSRVRFVTELDGEKKELFMLPEGYKIGSAKDTDWSSAVLNNQRKISFDAVLSKGEHELIFKAVEAGTVIEKIEINSSEDDSFYGCPFTYVAPF
ncbi:MAG: glycosyl hydrolase 115 family protein [Clostridiales bacterium]|nr:glycosyl hydrolase 115 family protein [Clostridiales bacterium]